MPDLIGEIRRQIPEGGFDFGLLFMSSHFSEKADECSRAIREELAPRVLIGCTGEGVIGSEEEIERSPAITLAVAQFPNVELTPVVFPAVELQRARSEGRSPLENAEVPDSTRLFLMVADPFTTPMDHLLDSYNETFPGVPIIGGLASGARPPGKNALIVNDQVLRDGAATVAFSGDVAVDVIVSQGCRPVGPALEVTDVRDNVIRHLEGKPPLDHIQDLVEELSGEDRELLRNGLFVGRAIDSSKEVLGRGDFLIRGVTGLDQKNGAIAVGDLIEEGEIVQFHLRDAATAREDLEMMLTPQSLFGQPSGAFLFSCNGRGTRVYDHANGDISSIREFFPRINLAGFFCAGEIGPIGGRNFLHGHTASLALIRPRSTPTVDPGPTGNE
jgi:small ligand-binding sensory domain FIST